MYRCNGPTIHEKYSYLHRNIGLISHQNDKSTEIFILKSASTALQAKKEHFFKMQIFFLLQVKISVKQVKTSYLFT